MEGMSTEAASLAGHWGLGKLIALYDDNHISIDGDTEIAFTEDVSARFDALGWHTIWVKDGNTDLDALRAAIEEAKSVTDKPTMIKVQPWAALGKQYRGGYKKLTRSVLCCFSTDHDYHWVWIPQQGQQLRCTRGRTWREGGGTHQGKPWLAICTICCAR